MASAAEPLPVVTYERTPGAASAPLSPGYRRREPQNTAFYRIVQQNLETFLAEPQLQGRAHLHPDSLLQLAELVAAMRDGESPQGGQDV